MTLGHKIALSKSNWERKPADFYPTPPESVTVLLDYLRLKPGTRVREPCCGEGDISRLLHAAGLEVTSSDIRHTGYGQGGVNYITMPEVHPTRYDMQAVITNPPFKDAEAIIRRAMRDAPIVAMFLPNGYWHAKGRIALFHSRPPAAILALTWRPVFLPQERGVSPLANYLWTVWNSKHVGPTEYHVVRKPKFRNVKHLPPPVEVTLKRLENSMTAWREAMGDDRG